MTTIVPTNFSTPLTGNEMLRAFGQNSSAVPSCGEDFLLSTSQIANLASSNPQAPIAVGAATTAVIGKKYLLNTASGSVLTLPAATGTGGTIIAIVTTTASSNKHAILANSVSDFMQGVAFGHVSAGTTLGFQANAATSHSVQMPFAGTQPSGGFAGDYFEFIDIGANKWEVNGMYQSGTTSTTPFSTATT